MKLSTRYLEKVLALDPAQDTSRIFNIRDEFFKGTLSTEEETKEQSPAVETPEPSSENQTRKLSLKRNNGSAKEKIEPPIERSPTAKSRADVTREIDNLHSVFWHVSKDVLEAEAKSIDTSEFPDLRARIDRILFLNTQREALEPDPNARSNQFDFFQEMSDLMLLPPKEAIERKDWLINMIERLAQPKAILKDFKLVKKIHPKLYALEREYFDNLESMLRAQSKHSAPEIPTSEPSASSDQSSSKGVGFLVVLIFLVIVGVVSRIR